jgi:mannose-6-phosphate isomerase-like protein (cupin superfamily)
LAVMPPDQPRHSSNGLAIAVCSGYAGSGVIDALRLTVTQDRPPPAFVRHPGEEWLYVVSGTLRLEYDGKEHRLFAGTVAHFDAEVPHRLGSDESAAEVLLVVAKPIRNLQAVH